MRLLIPIAILFNPIVPIHFKREVWVPIDIVCAVLMLMTRKAFYENNATKSTS